MSKNLSQLIASMKGISGSGNALAKSIEDVSNFLRTLEPGDIVRSDHPLTIAAPIAYDVWYLWCDDNFLAKYFADVEDFEADYYDYDTYITQNLWFLDCLTGLKSLKTLRNLKEQLSDHTYFDIYDMTIKTEWTNNGIYWINTAVFELWNKGFGAQYPSEGIIDFNIDNYVGYITIPIGQLGVMEVLSLIQETDLCGYQCSNVDSLSTYWPKLALDMSSLTEDLKPIISNNPEIFPSMKDDNGNALNGNSCFGRHLIENAYLPPTVLVNSQNTFNSSGETAYAPIPKLDVELFSNIMAEYPVDVNPKKWMRYWIHKDSTLPVPGEFIGIICKPVLCPPHVWFFQESSPFVYAGNWVEINNLTSGVITEVTTESARTDSGTGNLYKVKIQGCEIYINASDFLLYSVGDRVAILKVDSTLIPMDKSFTWLNQPTIKLADSLTTKTNYVILPMTFYKIKN